MAYQAFSNGESGASVRAKISSNFVELYGSLTGSASIVTVGTVTTGVWHGSAIADAYISSAATWNAKQNALTAGTDYLAPGGNGSALIGLTKAQVGLGSVDNTSDAAKNSAARTVTNMTLGTGSVVPVIIQLAASDASTAITAGTSKVTFRMPHAMTVTAVRASVATAPTGSTLIIDINEAGTTILSTKLSIAASAKTSVGGTAPVISDNSLADDAEITVDFDQVGATVAGAGVVVTLIGTRTL